MLPRCLVFCALLLAPSSANVIHFGRNIALGPDSSVHNATCFLCSVSVETQAGGNIRVFAGNVFLNGPVAGNVLVFGGNLTLTGGATIGGRVVVFGGHFFQDPAAAAPSRIVLSPIIFLPLIVLISLIIGVLIAITRRMVRGPVSFPPLPRL